MRPFADACAALLDLAFPTRCVQCGSAGAVWCVPCRQMPPGPASVWVGDLVVHAAADYAGGLRTALLAYKERGHRGLAPLLAGLLLQAVDAALPGGAHAEQTVLVPVPSRRSAARARGGDHLLRLATECATQYRSRQELTPPPDQPPRALSIGSALRLTGQVRDSAGLSSEQRVRNLDHRMQARPPDRGGQLAVLVDDIVTTGTTLSEAHRALREAGWRVSSAACVAMTARRSVQISGHRSKSANSW